MNIDYTLWPNTDGNLGNIKVQIPTGIGDDKWPEGDALVGNFVYNDGKLVGFVDTKALTVNDSKSTTIDYDYINIEVSFAENEMVFNRGARNKYFHVTFNENAVEGINGDYMFANMETTNLFDFTPLTDEEIDSVSLDEYTSANHMFTGRLIQTHEQLTELGRLFYVFTSPDESIPPTPMRIPSDTCLGIIFGGNTKDDEWSSSWDGSDYDGYITGDYYVHDMQEVEIIDGIADIEIENKIYHYDSKYDSNGFLYMKKISFLGEDNPYFILVYGEQLQSSPKPMSNE